MQAGTLAMGSSALLATIPQTATATSIAPAQSPHFATGTDFLAEAKSAADWLLSIQKSDEFGVLFPSDPAAPGKIMFVDSSPDCFYAGSAGTVLMLAELASKTNEQRYRDAAIAGAERLVRRWPIIADMKMEPIDMRWSISFGISGIGVVLYYVGKLLAEPRYIEASAAIADRLLKEANPSNPQGTWTPLPGYIADSSTVLYLIHAAKAFKRDRYLHMARLAGDKLIALASQESDGSLAWRKPQNVSIPHLYYPNFELGTAGVVYTLTALFEATRDQRYLEAAKRGANHLISLAVVNGDAALIPYALPDHADIFYLGFCHGAAGTARAFYKLHQQTGDRLYLDWTNRLVQGILSTGAPELESPGMWNTVTQCCGVGSHVELFLGLWATFGDPRYLALAQRAGKVIVSRASNLDGKGNKWFMAWARVDPAVVNAETGYMIGTSGIAAALLHLHLANTGAYDVALPIENPFPAKRLVV